MSNKFNEYGFKRKIFQELECTGIKGEALKGEKYGYSREFKMDDNTTMTFNIIPNGTEWICEKRTIDWNIFNEISDYEITNNEEFANSSKGRFDYAMDKLGYTTKSYQKISRWAYLESKEEALNEILEQYPYLFE